MDIETERAYKIRRKEMQDYFYTAQPSDWMRRPDDRVWFTEIYGLAALSVLDRYGVVPENINPAWVGNAETEKAKSDRARDLMQKSMEAQMKEERGGG